MLAELAPDMARLVAPVVEQVARQLTEGQGTKAQPLAIPTLLTQGNRSAGRDGARVKPKREAKPELTVPWACTACGMVLERQDRDHCEDCMPDEVRAGAKTFREKGRATLEALRAAGEDPAHSDEANRQRREKVAQRQRELRKWEVEHGGEADSAVFLREILPRLRGVSLGAMAEATGLSEGYCSFIRRGIKIPHPRHWESLRHLRGTR